MFYFNAQLKKRTFFFQAEDGIRDCLLSRGLGDVYKRQGYLSGYLACCLLRCYLYGLQSLPIKEFHAVVLKHIG